MQYFSVISERHQYFGRINAYMNLMFLFNYYTVLNNYFIILKVTAQGVSFFVWCLSVPKQSHTICQDCFSLIMDQNNCSNNE